jgi:uncharacterized protein YjiS (DUF1127 family)
MYPATRRKLNSQTEAGRKPGQSSPEQTMPYKTASTFPQSISIFFRAFAISIVALHEKIAAAIERRRIRYTLGKLDDYMLKDMGIVRSDIERIANRTYPPR